MDTATILSPELGLYERDLYAWCEQQAVLLRASSGPSANTHVDCGNVAEEIAALGRSQKDALRSHVTILDLHLINWRHQPDRRGASWANSIANARAEIVYALEDSPSLRPFLGETFDRAYPIAVREAENETALPRGDFPANCPFTAQQLLDVEFLPTDIH